MNTDADIVSDSMLPAEFQVRNEMAERIAAFDWSATPLGARESWPQSLRTVVNIILTSRYQMWMAWGPELTFFCNDAYIPTLGIKHPGALGRPTTEVWAEIWPEIGPRIQSVLSTGQATYEEGLLLILERSGFPEETYHTFSYSPLADDAGRVTGMLCVVTEETQRVIGERRVRTLRDVASGLAGTNTQDEVLEALKTELSRNPRDLPFTLTYLYDNDFAARLAASSGISSSHPLAPESIAAGANSPWPAAELLRHPTPTFVDCSDYRMPSVSAGDWDKVVSDASVVPVRRQGHETPAGFFVVGINPYRRYDSGYTGFIDLLSGQIAAAIDNARAYETERRRAEALAALDRAKTTFFSNVSHELRTPLTLMLSPVEELLARNRESGTGDAGLLELVHRNGLRLQKLVNSLLDFSRIEAGRMQAAVEPTDLARLTTELAANFASAMEKAGLEFTVDCPPLPEPVYVDRDMWEKVVLNLLSNALKFTFEGSVRLSLGLEGDSARLSVSDTGTGIPASELPHIFERFHRVSGARGRSLEGTGIGLALVQELVKLHGGSIQVSSVIGSGTEFRVIVPLGSRHLPAEMLKPVSNPQTSRADSFVQEALRWFPSSTAEAFVTDPVAFATLPASRERILLADDNADMRDYVNRLLGTSWDVTAVGNGEEALASALSNPPDLILSDVMMPALDGFELLKALRDHPLTRTIPVILLSARAGEESRVEGLDAGADDYLIKPFTARELVARVSAHLSMRRRRQEAEDALLRSQAALQSFYDSSPFLMGIVELPENAEYEEDGEGGEDIVAVYCNAATARFVNTDVAEMHGSSFQELGLPRASSALWARQYRQSRAEGQPVRFEYEYPLPGGNNWMSACVNFLGIGPGGRPQFSYIAEDITARRKNDELLRQSNRELLRANADLEQFAYSASHDLQEPLRQIAIYSQLLAKKCTDRLDPKGLEYLNFCIEGAQRMEQLIRGLLAWSQVARASDSPTQPVEIEEIIGTVVKNLSTAIADSGAEIVAAGLPTIEADAAPLVHLFQNLVSNALKYRSAERPRVVIAAVADGKNWLFSVADNGIGIPKQFQKQIFGIFKRLHDRSAYPGTGIGLAICQKIVERYGGRIWVESEPDRGSTFFFTLPRVDYER